MQKNARAKLTDGLGTSKSQQKICHSHDVATDTKDQLLKAVYGPHLSSTDVKDGP